MAQTTTDGTTEYRRIAGLTDSECHGLLASERRRAVLEAIEGRQPPVGLADLAAASAEREPGLDPDDPDAVERVQVSLHHVHLPKMDDFGVVGYDPDAHRLTF